MGTEDFWACPMFMQTIVVTVKALFKVLVMDIVALIEVIMVVVVAIVLAVVVASRKDWATNDDAALDDGESGEGWEVQQEGDVECSENCFVVHIAVHCPALIYSTSNFFCPCAGPH